MHTCHIVILILVKPNAIRGEIKGELNKKTTMSVDLRREMTMIWNRGRRSFALAWGFASIPHILDSKFSKASILTPSYRNLDIWF